MVYGTGLQKHELNPRDAEDLERAHGLKRLMESGDWRYLEDVLREGVQRAVDAIVESQTTEEALKFVAQLKANVGVWRGLDERAQAGRDVARRLERRVEEDREAARSSRREGTHRRTGHIGASL